MNYSRQSEVYDNEREDAISIIGTRCYWFVGS